MATRILVIDDEEDYRIIMSDVLGSEGYDIRLANDGKEGGSRSLRTLRPMSSLWIG